MLWHRDKASILMTIAKRLVGCPGQRLELRLGCQLKRRLNSWSRQNQVWFNVARAVEQTQEHDRIVLVPIDHNVLEPG